MERYPLLQLLRNRFINKMYRPIQRPRSMSRAMLQRQRALWRMSQSVWPGVKASLARIRGRARNNLGMLARRLKARAVLRRAVRRRIASRRRGVKRPYTGSRYPPSKSRRI